jgi:SAM-dependent methyltransferase
MASSDEGSLFYERFWEDADYQFRYAFQAAVHERFPAIQKVWGGMLPPRQVLDFGCGNGALAYWMHSHGFGSEIVGLDVSATAIQFASRHFARPGLRFQTFSADVGLAGLGRFDVVVASHVLEHLEKPERALAEVAQLTEWLVLEVPLEDSWISRLISRLRARHRAENAVGHVNFWTRESFRALVESVGLVVVRDFQYAAAPFSAYQTRTKRLVERGVLNLLGTQMYGRLLATHYAMLLHSRAGLRIRC